MNRSGDPNSPLSLASNDSGYHSRFDGPPTLSNAAYKGNPYGAPRPLRTSPPSSQHPSSSTDMSRPSAAGSSVGRPPSSASSIGQQSSYGRQSGAMPRPPMPGRKIESEESLYRHYDTLKDYLAASLQDEKGNIRPNRARDKLLRLSPTQFMELSTDVFDELIRREDDRLQRVSAVPRSLPPKSTFHPKRNQARQKLSTLPLDRFRQLATDVFYELQRRIPQLAAGDLERPGSAASSVQSRGGMRPPPGSRPPPGYAGHGGPGSIGGMSHGPRPPQPKTFQSNTIIPNKSTMVEDDDEDEEPDEEEDAFGLDRIVSGFNHSQTPGHRNDDDRRKMEDQDLEIAQLRRKVESLEAGGFGDWSSLREELERKHQDAQKLNESLRRELDQLQKDKAQDEREVRAQHERSMDELRTQIDQHRSENEDLRAQIDQGLQQAASSGIDAEQIRETEMELEVQKKLTKEVRDEAMAYLKEMKELSRQNDQVIEHEEKLAAQVAKMEKDIDEWRHRYARIKSQNKSLRASTMGLNLQHAHDAGSLLRKETLISDSGLVKDVDVTRFQLAVDELVQVARQAATQPMLDSVKNVVICVQSITSSIGTDGYPTPSHSPLSPESNAKQPASVAKLKARVTGSANALITATKQHSTSMGLSPVTLLDAAASNLSAAIVELVKAVGIRPSPRSELQDSILDLDVPLNHTISSHSDVASFYDDSASPNDGHASMRSSSNSSGGPNPYLERPSLNEPNRTPLAIQVRAPSIPPSTSGGAGGGNHPYASSSPPTNQSDSVYAAFPDVPTSSEKPKPAPLNLGLGRSNTMKKWFGWGRGGGDDNGAVTPIATTPLTAGGPLGADGSFVSPLQAHEGMDLS